MYKETLDISDSIVIEFQESTWVVKVTRCIPRTIGREILAGEKASE